MLKQREWGADLQLIAQDQQLMKKKFPQFKLLEALQPVTRHNWLIAPAKALYWVGKLRTYSGNTYTVALTYPEGYPYAQMKCFVIDPYIERTEHRYLDGHLCLFSNDHGGRGDGYESRATTAITYVGWTAAWLHAYEIYMKKGIWPMLKFNQ